MNKISSARAIFSGKVKISNFNIKEVNNFCKSFDTSSENWQRFYFHKENNTLNDFISAKLANNNLLDKRRCLLLNNLKKNKEEKPNILPLITKKLLNFITKPMIVNAHQITQVNENDMIDVRDFPLSLFKNEYVPSNVKSLIGGKDIQQQQQQQLKLLDTSSKRYFYHEMNLFE